MKPVLQALLVADHVYTDRASGKCIVAGTFNRYWLSKPAAARSSDERRQLRADEVSRIGSPYAYVSLTDVQGQVDLEFRYVSLKDHQILFTGKLQIESNDPLQTFELTIPLPPIPIPHPGVFALELLWDNEILGSHRITAEFKEEVGE
ncbi:MAG: hypothetical protein KY476_17785 [Planctomycetes bacterium]|nr:hypothetical protein [Planctomycetota bacterium]